MLTARGLSSDLVDRLAPKEEFWVNGLDFGAPAFNA